LIPGDELSKLYKRLMMFDYEVELYKGLRYFFISVSILTFIILALTGIIPVLILNEQIGGLFLIIHVTIAPFFVVALTMTALFWAHFQQFNQSDFIFIKELRNKKDERNRENHKHTFWPRIHFWLFLAFSVPASLSMIFSMFPYFGTEGQFAMLNIHRYSTLVLLIIVLFYIDLKITQTTRKLEK
jgi:hypothetical protein